MAIITEKTIKEELLGLIKDEKNLDVLKSVRDLLEKERKESRIKEIMLKRARKSEEDVKAGRVYTREEAEAMVRQSLKI